MFVLNTIWSALNTSGTCRSDLRSFCAKPTERDLGGGTKLLPVNEDLIYLQLGAYSGRTLILSIISPELQLQRNLTEIDTLSELV